MKIWQVNGKLSSALRVIRVKQILAVEKTPKCCCSFIDGLKYRETVLSRDYLIVIDSILLIFYISKCFFNIKTPLK